MGSSPCARTFPNSPACLATSAGACSPAPASSSACLRPPPTRQPRRAARLRPLALPRHCGLAAERQHDHPHYQQLLRQPKWQAAGLTAAALLAARLCLPHSAPPNARVAGCHLQLQQERYQGALLHAQTHPHQWVTHPLRGPLLPWLWGDAGARRGCLRNLHSGTTPAKPQATSTDKRKGALTSGAGRKHR